VKLIPAQPPGFHRAGPKALDQNIGLRDQRADYGAGIFVLEIERDAPFIAVGAHEIGAVTVPEWRITAGHIAAGGVFDLDYVGAEIAKCHARVGSRQGATHVDYGYIVKWRIHRTKVDLSCVRRTILLRESCLNLAQTVAQRSQYAGTHAYVRMYFLARQRGVGYYRGALDATLPAGRPAMDHSRSMFEHVAFTGRN
jgi:hypothetical protein